MDFKSLISNKVTVKEFGALELKSIEYSGSLSIFEFYNSKGLKIELGNEIDYLALYSEIAAMIYNSAGKKIESLVMVTEMGGKRLFIIDFPLDAQKKYYDAFGFFLAKQKELEVLPKFNFIGDIRFELSSNPLFEKNSKKVIRGLDGDNKISWENLVNDKKNFIKTELFIYSLQKLNSWSFQPISNQDKSLEDINCVYGNKPIPRGADLKKK